MSPLRKSKAQEGFTIRHQYLMDSLKNKEKKKHLTTRELRGKEELQSVMENKGKEFQDRRVRCYEKLQQG